MVIQRLALVLAGTGIAVLAGEICFRLVPFERFKYELRFGHFSGNAVARLLEYDPVLIFRNRRGVAEPGAQLHINSLGLRGREISIAKPPGVTRIICLGDSCTFGGGQPYPQMLQAILDQQFGTEKFEVLNAGVIGYTSLHGLEWFRSELERLQPDIVTIYFGWNDMWRGKESAIREVFRRRIAGKEPVVRSYLWEATSRSLSFLHHRLTPAVDMPLQIPPERYRDVLEEFVRLAARGHFTPVLVTAPSGDTTPAWLVEKGFVARGDSVASLRETYNQVVIDVARSRGVPLADCATAFRAAGTQTLFERPDEDPIHPNEHGYRLITHTLADTISTIALPKSASAPP
jgi:lysophospholipase L1-like esterase